MDSDSPIIAREQALRAWFTQGADPVLTQIDGLDIGWGGVQRWATARMPPIGDPHLDFACGYGTFLAQLGWRFAGVGLVGLNIDYAGPHGLVGRLLKEAGVQAELVQADALDMPFAAGTFASASCFLGLQDIEIGFGRDGVRKALSEASRVLRPGGVLTLLDEFAFEKYASLLQGLPLATRAQEERALDVRWERPVAERAIALYARGWVVQARVANQETEEKVFRAAHRRMAAEMERQLSSRGYYVPFGPVRMVAADRVV